MREINISQDSWHFRLYMWWNDRSHFLDKKSSKFEENLCHYVRAVIWALGAWVLSQKVWRGIKVWMVAAALLAVVAYLLLSVVWPSMAMAIALVIMMVIVILVFTSLIDLIGAPIYKWLVRKLEKPLKPAALVLSKLESLYDARPRLARVLMGGIVAALLYGAYGEPLVQLTIIVAISVAICFALIAGAMVILSGIIYVAVEVIDYFRYRRETRRFQRGYQTHEPIKGESGTSLVMKAMIAKRGTRICPFIRLPRR